MSTTTRDDLRARAAELREIARSARRLDDVRGMLLAIAARLERELLTSSTIKRRANQAVILGTQHMSEMLLDELARAGTGPLLHTVAMAVTEAVAEEREACAMVADEEGRVTVARAIRARRTA